MVAIPDALSGAFGPDFSWGASTAAYQIEGAVIADGRGRSAWDDFCDRPGAIVTGESGAVACDHYHRYPEDIGLMSDLGIDAYRFSFAWPRIIPGGTGAVNQRGLDFYDRLVDALLEAGITPFPTLFHWDTPSDLETRGGWENRAIADAFAEYTHVIATRFADRIPRWTTLNEPNVFTLVGHAIGVHAPGKELGLGALTVGYHQLLAHGKAVEVLRAAGVREVGIAPNHMPVWPAGDREEDHAAADFYDMAYNRFFSDPVLGGRWPVEGMEDGFGGYQDADLASISAPLDFYGVNYYNPVSVGAPDLDLPVEREGPDGTAMCFYVIEGYPTSDFGWPLVPEGLTHTLRRLHDDYGDALPPIWITENGGAFNDRPDSEGRVRDTRRIDQLSTHLEALLAAKQAGVDIRGYVHWSLLDNFEWAEGYSKRFGLIDVDFESQKRTPKDSFAWYRALIASHRSAS